MEYLYKSLRAGLKSNHDGSAWVIGEWRVEKPPTDECVGLNASPRAIDAMFYAPMEIIGKVEVGGKIIKGKDKWTCEKMRIVEAYVWPKEESVRLAIFAAEKVLKNYESIYPTDDRPRKAIEAAKNYIQNPTEENQKAARSAAESAWSAAESAARSAAWSAADSLLNEIEGYILGRIEHLVRYSQ